MADQYAVFGLGKAGQAAIAELLRRGDAVFAWDDKPESCEKTRLQFPDITVQSVAEMPWDAIKALILSPGVPLTFPAPHVVVKLAQRHHVPVVCDIELLVQKAPAAHYTGITGTNGKSTTTALIGHLYQAGGLTTQVGGNIGVAAGSLPALSADGHYVLELSSYQLELLSSLRCRVAVFLNITPDHLDRHGDMAGYVAAKRHIFDRQQAGDVAVIAVDDDYTRELYLELSTATVARKLIPVSAQRLLPDGISVIEGVIHDRVFDHTNYELGALPKLNGQHNAQNIAASYAAARAVGVPAANIIPAIQNFSGLPHRMQWVGEYRNLLFINDSKATNAVAAEQALRSYQNIYWIAGGVPKAGGITSLTGYFPHMAHAFLIGEAAAEFAQTLDGQVAYTHSGTLEHAVQQAITLAIQSNENGVILLSPACASFDQFANYEQRGDRFMEQVRAWLAQQGQAASC